MLVVLCLFFIQSTLAAAASDRERYFSGVEKKLIQDGFDSGRVDALFRQAGVTFETRNVSLFFSLSKGQMDHSNYTDPKSIKKARTYMQKHQSDLDRIQTDAGVQKSVVTAIILVETRLGTTLGRSSVFNALSSIAALDSQAARDRVWDNLTDKEGRSRQSFDATAQRKASWAYRELKAFLTYTRQQKIDPLAVKGSFAGAMGIPQFMPSNIEHYAKDGNGDGTIDLFNHADAQASVANFLKRHGWKPGIDRHKKKKVIHHYNHSDDYVDTILRISDLLEA